MSGERALVALASFRDVLSADSLVAFLASHEIEAHVEGADPLSIGLGGRVRVVLAEEDLRRARWAIEQAKRDAAEPWLRAAGAQEAGEVAEAPPREGRPRVRGVAATLAAFWLAALVVAALASR